MLSIVKRVLGKKKLEPVEEILKYDNGKRFYPDFHSIRKSNLDPDAIKVIGRLHQFSHKAYVVGGCVRDLLLGRQPKDFDIVTSATPNEIRKIFANSRLIGKRFKIVHIVFHGNKVIEVATARSLPKNRKIAKDKDELLLSKDNDYGSFKEDAARRDFTINSLFFDVRNETILDYTGGFEDLNEKLVRIIGDENISLPEDPVRMLRAIKFASLLDFGLHPQLEKGIRKYKKLITKASTARLHEEYNKVFRTGQTQKIIKEMIRVELFEAMFPNLYKASAEQFNSFNTGFESSLLGKFISIADRMISEHEDINTTIYYALLITPVVMPIIEKKTAKKGMRKEIRAQIKTVESELGLTKKESERILDIYASQHQFHREVKERNGWTDNFKNKEFFVESFTYYKIYNRALKNNEAVQKALFWEIGLRKKLPNAIRKARYRPIQKLSPRQKPKSKSKSRAR